MKMTNMNNSLISFGRNYIYRVELPVLLSTTSSVSMVMLRRTARLSQIRRMHLNKIRASRSLIRKSNELRKSFELTQNNEQSIEVNHQLMSTCQTILPSFQRFTNCLTRFNTVTDVKLKLSNEVLGNKPLNLTNNRTNRSSSTKSTSFHQFKNRPKTISLDRKSKQLMIDNASKTAVINQPYTVTSSLLKETAAYELSRNPYFITSHSPNNLTKKYSLDENNNKTPDHEQLNTETSTSRSSLDQQALLLAKQKQMMDVIDLLLKRGANPNTGIRPLPALFLAVQAGDPDMVRKLIQHGADANICLRVDNPSKSENRSSTGIYIDEDEAPLMPSLDGLTVLHYAVLVPDEMGVQLTEILLKDGQADPNKQATLDDSFKLKTEYNAFIQSGSSSETISGKSTPEVKKTHEGRTPLHLVCSREYDLPNSAIIAECLLRHNANPNLLCNGHSALSVAIAVGNDPCINVLLNHENTNINQPLENDLGSALCIACSKLIKRLINKGGIDSFKTFVISKPKGILGNVIDFTYMDYAKDTRIAKTPYHALNDIEKETYNGRMQILAYLAERLRNFAYTIEDTTDNEQITLDKIELHNKQMNQKTISSPIKTYSSKFSRQESPTYLKQNSCLPYSFCYECGRSAGVRLVLCSRCHRVYFCSKVCKLKSWTTRHKNECYLTPELQAERNRRSPTKVQSDLKGDKQIRDTEIALYILNTDVATANKSISGELIGVILHPSYRYQYLLHHYMKTDEKGHIIIGTYDGDGNYSLG
ncbi:Ankyrin repeat and MYND domain-containing protein [Schistosoma japonicum]|uniref:Ankyrin repeat and MYND domain-containing protein n=1 Tax=Schistosoma japonicum TaxID=6182 RepID=A0A4Z2DFI7_SCHJA|nr:Ankyrin repeat and MYND domain-containing protein [Schistosoma japonicum]